ncbi:MAG: transcriptional regulator [Actinobacteria bacterium]|nr:transcriptional regulator [Actinomycetota bacterium]
MSVNSDPDLRVVHALRVRGLTDMPELATAVGLGQDEVGDRLVALADAGHVQHRDGRMPGWMLTRDGRAHGETLVAAELDVAGEREAVADLYRRFLGVNLGFLELCTDWQLRGADGEQVVNDHSDAAYDAAVIARLVDADGVVQPICGELAELLTRFDGYGRRFGGALGRVRAGEVEWFTRPMIDSYHTVWFELHEDLLATLGIERAREGEQA